MRRSTRPEPISAPSSKTSITDAGCIQRSATNPRLSSKPNSANSKPSERTQPRLCHSNPVSQPRGAVHYRHSNAAGSLIANPLDLPRRELIQPAAVDCCESGEFQRRRAGVQGQDDFVQVDNSAALAIAGSPPNA